MSENKENKLTLINEKTANDYLTHTNITGKLMFPEKESIITILYSERAITHER